MGFFRILLEIKGGNQTDSFSNNGFSRIKETKSLAERKGMLGVFPPEGIIRNFITFMHNLNQMSKNFKGGGSCKTLESSRKSSFRASEARPGIQDFQAILDSGFRRKDGVTDFCKRLGDIPNQKEWRLPRTYLNSQQKICNYL